MIVAFVFLVFACFAVAVIMRPPTIVALAVTMYGFEQWAQANSSFFGRHSSLVQLAFGLLTLLAVASVAFRGQNPLNPITGAMVTFTAFYAFAAFSLVWALDRELSMFLFKYHAPYMLTFCFLVPLVIRNRDDIQTSLIATLVFGSIVMVLLLTGTGLHAYGRTIEATGVKDRVGGVSTRLGPLAIAEFAGQMLLISFLMNFRGVHRFWQVGRFAIGFLALGLIFRSQSRGQLIAAIIALVMFITLSRGTKKLSSYMAAGISTMIVMGFAVFSFLGFADQDRWDVDRMSNAFQSTRLDMVSKLFSFWAGSSPVNWLIGLGISGSYDARVLGRYCHVVMVEILCELGFVGISIVAIFMFFIVRDLVSLYRLTKDNDVDRGISITLAAIFVYQLMLTFKQGSILTHAFSWCWALMISRHAAVMRISARKEKALEWRRRWWFYQQQVNAQQQSQPQSLEPV